jgi:quercetin dioxygenase-like cupin family protein
LPPEKGIEMMTRREMNTTLGALLATLFSGTIASLSAQSATPQQHSGKGSPPTVLLQESIGDPGDCDAQMLILKMPPKLATPPHEHSGPLFAYVLEGLIESQIDPEQPKTYKAGDFWFEPAMHVHRTFRNLSDTQVASILVFDLIPKGKPAGVFLK